MPTAAECIKGECKCASAKHCSFLRCPNCDWPIDTKGQTLVDHSSPEHERCPDCNGPTGDNPRVIYGAK